MTTGQSSRAGYFLSMRPPSCVRAVVGDAAGRRATRYLDFARGGALVLGESSRFLWVFVF